MERKKLVLVAGIAVIVALSLLFFLLPQQTIVDNEYTVSFGNAKLSKKVVITSALHREDFTVNQGKEISLLVVVPKSLAQNQAGIKSSDSLAASSVIEPDPIIKFVQESGKPFWAKLEFLKAGKDICTIAILLPNSYMDSLSDAQLEELKTELVAYGEMDLDCEEANQTEQELAERLEEVFVVAELKEVKEENSIRLEAEKTQHSRVLDEIKSKKKDEPETIRTEASGDHQRVLSVLQTVRAEVRQAAGIASLQISFVDKPVAEATTRAELRDYFPFPKRIDLTVSEAIPKSYYSAFLIFPEKNEIPLEGDVSPGPPSNISFESDSLPGFSKDFNFVVFGKEEPHRFELHYAPNRGIPDIASGAIVFTYDTFPKTEISVPITIWRNACKAIAEEKSSKEILTEVIDCRDLEIGVANAIFANDLAEEKKQGQSQLKEFIEENNVRFISEPRLKQISERFEGYTLGAMDTGLSQAKTSGILVNDEQQLIDSPIEARQCPECIGKKLKDKLPELGEIRGKIYYSGKPEIISNSFQLFENANKEIGEIAKEMQVGLSNEELAFWQELEKETGKNSARAAAGKDKWLAEHQLILDPFKPANRQNFIEKVLALEQTMVDLNSDLSSEEKSTETSKAEEKKKNLQEMLDEQYGSQYELIELLEKEKQNIEETAKKFEEAIAKKSSYWNLANPLRWLGNAFSLLGDAIFGDWGKTSEEEAKQVEKLGNLQIYYESQGRVLGLVIKELEEGKSLIETGKEFKEKAGLFGNVFIDNDVLRSELRKQRIVIEKPFIASTPLSEAFYSTLHSLESERDNLLFAEILAEEALEKYTQPSETLREANLHNAIVRTIQRFTGAQGAREQIDKQFSFNQERKGIEKIVNQLNQGIVLLEIAEANKEKDSLFKLDSQSPKTVSIDVSIELIETSRENGKAKIRAYEKGVEKGEQWVQAGEPTGFYRVPGLVVKLFESMGDSSATVTAYHDLNWQGTEPVDRPFQKFDIVETGRPGVLAAFGKILATKKTGKKLWSSTLTVDPPDEYVAAIKFQVLFFDSISKAEAKKALDSAWFWPGISDIEKAVRKRNGKYELVEFYEFAEGFINESETEVSYPKEFSVSSSKFPGITIDEMWLNVPNSWYAKMMDQKNHRKKDSEVALHAKIRFSDLVAEMDKATPVNNSKWGETFSEYLVVKNGSEGVSINWLQHEEADSYVVIRGGEKISGNANYYGTSFSDSPQEKAFHSYQIQALDKEGTQIGLTPLVSNKFVPASTDLSILAGLGNEVMAMQVKKETLLESGQGISKESEAEILFRIGQGYKRKGILMPALQAFDRIEKDLGNTPHALPAKIAKKEVQGEIGDQKVEAVLEGITSTETAATFAVLWGVGKAIQIGQKVYYMTSARRTNAVASSSRIMQANRVLTTSKWTSFKAFMNTPVDDLIARGIAKPILKYQQWRLSKNIQAAEAASAELSQLGAIRLVKADSMLASKSMPGKTVSVSGREISVVDTGAEYIYINQGNYGIAVQKSFGALEQAVPQAKKLAKALKYLEKKGLVPKGATGIADDVQAVLADALKREAVNIVTVEATVIDAPIAEITSNEMALAYIGNAFQPLSVTTSTGAVVITQPVVTAFDIIAGRAGALVSEVMEVPMAASMTDIGLVEGIGGAPAIGIARPLSTTPKTISVSQTAAAKGKTILASQCSCIVDVPAGGDEIRLYFRDQGQSETLMTVESPDESLSIVNINTGAPDEVTHIVLGKGLPGNWAESPFVSKDVPAIGSVIAEDVGNLPLVLTDFKPEGFDAVFVEKETALVTGKEIEVTAIKDGGRDILLIRTTGLQDKTIVLSTEKAVGIVAPPYFTVPVPTQGTIPKIDQSLAEKWLAESPTKKIRAARQKLLDNVEHISFEEFQAELLKNTDRLNSELLKNDKRFAVIMDEDPSSPQRWVYDLCKDNLARQPDVVTYMPKADTILFNETMEKMARKRIHTFVFVNDAAYTGMQIRGRMRSIISWYLSNRPEIKPTFIVAVPYSTQYGAQALKGGVEFVPKIKEGATIKVVNENQMKTVREILTAEEYAHIKMGDRTVTFFDHKLADEASFHPDVKKLFGNPGTAPYSLEGRGYTTAGKTQFDEFLATGKFVYDASLGAE